MISANTMRWADRWLGIPLCWLATRLTRLLSLHREPTRAQSARNVLFIELVEMGSVILADPAVRFVRDTLGATPFFVVFRGTQEALRVTRTVAEENVFVMRAGGAGQLAVDLLRFHSWCRRRRIDAVVDLEIFSRFSALLALLSGASRRCGFHAEQSPALYRGHLFTRPVAYDRLAHISLNFLALAREISRTHAAPTSRRFDGRLPAVSRRATSASEQAVVRTRLAGVGLDVGFGGRFMLLNPNVGDLVPQRRWPLERYADLARRALERWPDLQVGIIGSHADRMRAQRLQENIASERCRNLAGLFSLAELPALFEFAEVMVTGDSGPAHFASVTAMRVIVLFGPESPTRYRPLGNAVVVSKPLACSPCISPENQRRSYCIDNLCLQGISVDVVLQHLIEAFRDNDSERRERIRQRAA